MDRVFSIAYLLIRYGGFSTADTSRRFPMKPRPSFSGNRLVVGSVSLFFIQEARRWGSVVPLPSENSLWV